MQRRGFTLLELIIASSLFAYFTLLVMQLNVQSARFLDNLTDRAGLATESKLAYRFIVHDLGSASDVTWNGVNEQLNIIQGATTVCYSLDGTDLMRTRQGVTVLVAKGVSSFSADYSTSTQGLEIDIVFQSGNRQRCLRLHRSYPQA